jgi:hypothetical protein
LRMVDMTGMEKVDTLTADGVKVRVLVPEGGGDPSEGIPVSLDMFEIFPDAPVSFVKRLTEELWALDLVEAWDFTRPGASDKVRSALLAAVKRDTLDIMALAKENLRNGR